MKLPQSLIEAFNQGYRDFSWVTELTDKIPPLTLFDKSQAHYQGQRFYWQTPDQELILVGCGQTNTLHPCSLSDQALTRWLSQKQQSIYHNQRISGTGALLFGGLPFNQEHPSPDIWGELDQGLFYLPALMISCLQSKMYVTLNFSAATSEELEVRWQERQHEIADWLKAPPSLKASPSSLSKREIGVTRWLEIVEQTVAAIKEASSLKKVVLARQLEVTSQHSWQPTRILNQLVEQQPQTYVFALEAHERLFIGASPERLLQSSQSDYYTACIAGSIARGQSPEEDYALGQTLLTDSKNQQEHQIVVNQIAGDFQQMIDETLLLPKAALLKNRDIQHLHVPLRGKRKLHSTLLEGVKQLHPTPALGGQPKALARDFIAQYEPLGRGMYGGPIGWVSLQDDSGEFAVGIRSAILSQKTAYLYAGCGIVADSIPELERQETAIKFQPMLRSLS